MSMKNCLPFEAGQMVEVKSFIQGYRGAWFRCKINKLRMWRRSLQCTLEYCDFPDEEVKWTSVYEAPPKAPGASSGLDQRTKELMIRPHFPSFYKESKLPPQHSPAEVRAVVNDAWRVGDLVDLWYDSCYWSGKIINFDADDSVEVELPGPPIGEGGSYKGVLKDLRPSLNWSLEKGWSVPISQENGDSWHTARLVRQSSWRSLDNELDQSAGSIGNSLDPSFVLCLEARKETPTTSNPLSEKSRANSSTKHHSNHKNRNFISSNDQPSIRDSKSPETQPDMIDKSIMELEEVANKIRWLKGLLQFGFTWSNDRKPSWKFLPNTEQ